MSRCLREILAAGLLVTVAVVPFLFSPRPVQESENCLKTMEIWGPVHVNVNCDAGEHLLVARNPSILLTPEHKWRQNRPLYGALGWALALPFQALGFESIGLHLLGGQLTAKSDLGPSAFSGKYLPEYVGYLLLNWLLLVASVMILRRLLAATSFLETSMLLPLAILLVNEVTKVFFWTPHTQMFNIFVPVASLCLFRWMQTRLQMLTWYHVTVIGLLLGLGNLAYGSFAVTAGGATLCVLMGEGFCTLRKHLAAKVLSGLLLLALFFMPLAAWIMFVTNWMGSFYSYEIVEFNQFVWLLHSWSQGAQALYADLSRNLAAYLETMAFVATFPALVLTGLTVVAYTRGAAWQPTDRDGDMGRAILWYVLANIPFYALMGYPRTRLSWTIVPALLIVLGIEIRRLELALSGTARQGMKAGVVGLTICYVAYWIAKAGPYY